MLMGMSGPCKWCSSISVGDEPLARSRAEVYREALQTWKRLSAASCKKLGVEAEAMGSTWDLCNPENDDAAKGELRGQQRTENHVPLSLEEFIVASKVSSLRALVQCQ
jgi:hypothetical protein